MKVENSVAKNNFFRPQTKAKKFKEDCLFLLSFSPTDTDGQFLQKNSGESSLAIIMQRRQQLNKTFLPYLSTTAAYEEKTETEGDLLLFVGENILHFSIFDKKNSKTEKAKV